jgi:dTDP-4-dehydrorhamnose reductase
MKCLILGGSGQLGRALAATAPESANIAAPPRAGCDITDPAQLQSWFDAVRPALVINAAGYTDVNGAQSHEAEARAVNAQGAGALAVLCRRHGARLIHLSTDFVFDGAARTPYGEDAAPHPLNAYGCGKYEGEQLVRREHPQSLIVRTAWLYAEQGRNFVNTMLGLMAVRDEVKVVADQTGTPTYARNLAGALWRLAALEESGLYHFSDEGETSWHGFALAIRDEALAIGFLTRKPDVIAISAKDYPSPAQRPAYSVLDKSKIHAKLGLGQDWRAALKDMLVSKKRQA